MSISYKDLNIKKLTSSSSFDWGNKKVIVYNYIPIEDKYDLVMVTLQKSYENGLYNQIKLDMFFHLNLVYMYTDIVFTDEDREDECKLYDELKSSGFLAKFLSTIDKNQYDELLENIEDIAFDKINYGRSAGGVINKIINDLPANAEAVKEIVDSFDPEKYQQVIDFAKSANNGNVLPFVKKD